ncbi:hypothetical protein KIW84_053334 [Lathyrus oleraceus]|uniref:Uncharacterized protein n=1 Tax=Pisum sativum TaxID=3888 RepID=A0A9D5AG50_PEA|nr:hypothetical protein KIW84_053334 [Pisum sativum]
MKMSKPSGSTPSKSTKDKSAPRISCANVDHSDVVTNFVPLSIIPRHVPTKRRDRTLNVKKAKPSTKPHSMTSLYLDPIKTTYVEPDVVAYAKGFIVPKVVGSVKSSEKSNSGTVSLDNPRSNKTLGQSSMNVDDKYIVDKSISVLISQILGTELKSLVVPDVTTSLAQTDHPIETTLEKYDGKSDSEFVPIKSPEKSEEKDDSDKSMFVEEEKILSKEEEITDVKKDKSTNIANIDDLGSDDESIGMRLALSIAKY